LENKRKLNIPPTCFGHRQGESVMYTVCFTFKYYLKTSEILQSTTLRYRIA